MQYYAYYGPNECRVTCKQLNKRTRRTASTRCTKLLYWPDDKPIMLSQLSQSYTEYLKLRSLNAVQNAAL